MPCYMVKVLKARRMGRRSTIYPATQLHLFAFLAESGARPDYSFSLPRSTSCVTAALIVSYKDDIALISDQCYTTEQH